MLITPSVHVSVLTNNGTISVSPSSSDTPGSIFMFVIKVNSEPLINREVKVIVSECISRLLILNQLVNS